MDKQVLFKEILLDQYDFKRFLDYLGQKNETSQIDSISKRIASEFGGIKYFSQEYHKWITLQANPFLSTYSIESSSVFNKPSDSSTKELNKLESSAIEDKKNEVKPKKRTTPSILLESEISNNSSFPQTNTETPFTRTYIQPKAKLSPSSSKSGSSHSDFKINKPEEPENPNRDDKKLYPSTVQISISNKAEVIPQKPLDSSPLSSQEPTESKDELIIRASELYCSLIYSSYLNISIVVPYLARLSLGKQKSSYENILIKDQTCNPPSSYANNVTFLYDHKDLKLFVVNCIKILCPLLSSMGSSISSVFAETVFIKHDPSNSEIYSKLKIASELAYERELIDDTRLLNQDAYRRPFREDIDNRNEYKNQFENKAYNEREKCYDSFTNLFNKFQSISSSDLNGSKTAEFWAGLHHQALQILQFGDYNYPWFSELFLSMLMFYGPNVNNNRSKDVPEIIQKIFPQASFRVSKNNDHSHNNNNNNNNNTTTTNTYKKKNNSAYALKIQQKHEKLEERIAPPEGKSAYYSKTNNRASHQEDNNISAIEASQYFPGYQQFFFQFIINLDSHKFCEHLKVSLISEINKFSPINIFQNDPPKTESSSSSPVSSKIRQYNRESYLHQLVQLKLLGKFLGLLYFWPFWTTNSEGLKVGPMGILVDELAKKRCNISMPINLTKVIENSIQFSCLSISLPWVTEYLKMMRWDSSFKLMNPYKEVISLIYNIHRSKVYRMDPNDTVPTNRLFIIIVLEEFCGLIPDNLPVKFLKNIQKRVEGYNLNPIDDENFAFTNGFIRFLLPEFYKMIQALKNTYLASREKGNVNVSVSVNVSASDANTTNKVVKRQSPSLIKSQTISSPSFDSSRMSPNFKSISAMKLNTFQSQSSPVPNLLRSQSFSPPNLNASMNDFDNFGDSNIDDKLVNSFWQQHPKLFRIYGFIIDHHSSSCHERLRDKTRNIIREYWVRSADIKSEIDKSDSAKALVQYQSLLNHELKRIYSRAYNEAEQFLDDIYCEKIKTMLNNLFSLYPSHDRVTKLAIYLAQQNIKSQHDSLLKVFGLYTKRKLEEVLSLSLQQLNKSLKLRSVPIASSPRALSQPRETYYVNSKNDQCYKRIVAIFDLQFLDHSEDNNTYFLYLFKSNKLTVSLKDILKSDSKLFLLNQCCILSSDLIEIIFLITSLSSYESAGNLNLSSVNVYSLIISYLSYICALIEVLGGLNDMKGKVMIEVAKLFSVILPLLINLDMSCSAYYHLNKSDKKSSESLFDAEDLNLLLPSFYNRFLTVAVRKSVLKNFQSTRFINKLYELHIDGTLIFIENLMRRKYVLKSQEKSIQEGGDWYHDPSIHRDVKFTLGQELSDIITLLARLKNSVNGENIS